MSLTDNKLFHASCSVIMLLLFIGIFYLLIIYPALAEQAENEKRIETLVFQLQKFSHATSSIKSLQADIKQLESANVDSSGFLKAGSPSLAAAEMQSALKQIVEANDGKVVSAQVMREVEEDIYPRITLRTFIRADIESLRQIFYTLGTGDPLFIIDAVNIQKRQAGRKSEESIQLLDIRFEISGYMLDRQTA